MYDEEMCWIGIIGYLILCGILIAGLVGMGAIIFVEYSEIYRLIFIERTVSNIDLLIGFCLVCVVIAVSYPFIKLCGNMIIVSIENKLKQKR